MSDPKTVLLAAVDALEAGPFDYILYGGMAAAVWGEPRYTEDADIVLFVPEREVHRFLRSATAHGFSIDENLAIQQVQVSGWARLPYGEPGGPWHLDITLGDSPFDRSALERRKKVVLFDRPIWVASAEDMIIYKVVSGRERDLVDARSIGRRQQGLDAEYLRRWAQWWESEEVNGVRARVEEILAHGPTATSESL